MATAVMCDHAKAVAGEKQHLAVPCVGVQRPRMGGGDDGGSAPVFVVDRRSGFCCNDIDSVGALFAWLGLRRCALRSLSWGRNAGGQSYQDAGPEYVAAICAYGTGRALHRSLRCEVV